MSKIFEPYQLGEITIKNRILMAPMLMYTGQEDGKVNDLHLAHYAARALGGVGLITTEVVAVEPCGRISHKDLGLWNDEQIEGLSRLAEFIKNCGAKSCLQLAHAGRKATIEGTIFAPSAIAYSDQHRVPQALTHQEILNLVEYYKSATLRALSTNFDCLEIHAAHGYLLHEFLSPLTNHRDDEYGGSLENRFRFLVDIVTEVRKIWPQNKPLIVRLSVEDKAGQGGTALQDTLELCKILKSLNVNMISVSAGGLVPKYDGAIYPGFLIHYAETVKNDVEILVGCNGSITSSEVIEFALQNELTDFVYIGRELLRNPFWLLNVAKEIGVGIDLAIGTYMRATKPYERGH